MPQEDQPGDVRVNRANLLRRIGRVCFESGGEPGLPAPARVYVSPTVELHFDTLAEAAAWTARYDLHPRRWTSDGHLFVTATGLWEGVEIAVSSNQRQFAPADADPDDLGGERHTCTTCGYTSDGPCPWHAEPKSIEDAPPRGTDDAEGHTPKPADVAGYGHARGGNGFTEEPPSELTFTSTSKHDGALRRWDLTGPAGTVSFVLAEVMGIQTASASVFLRPPAGSEAETDTLVGRLARELHRDYLVAGDEQVIRTQLEHWYGERLAGGAA